MNFFFCFFAFFFFKLLKFLFFISVLLINSKILTPNQSSNFCVFIFFLQSAIGSFQKSKIRKRNQGSNLKTNKVFSSLLWKEFLKIRFIFSISFLFIIECLTKTSRKEKERLKVERNERTTSSLFLRKCLKYQPEFCIERKNYGQLCQNHSRTF